MELDDAKKAQLVEAIVEMKKVEAVGLIDADGNLRRIHGHAKVFRNGEPLDAPEDGGSENDYEDVYIASVAGDYLVVVFDTDEDFEPIKEALDGLLAKLEL